MTVTTTSAELKNLLKDAIKEALAWEFMKLRADLTPFVSDKEQREIERRCGKPTRKIAKSVKIKTWNGR